MNVYRTMHNNVTKITKQQSSHCSVLFVLDFFHVKQLLGKNRTIEVYLEKTVYLKKQCFYGNVKCQLHVCNFYRNLHIVVVLIDHVYIVTDCSETNDDFVIKSKY